MKGFIELTDSLERRCTIKVSAITQVSERFRYRYSELDSHPELGEKDKDGNWEVKEKTTYIQGDFPCLCLYVRESYEDVLRMMEEALK
ncbi:hypothetical protein [Bacteroides sp.]|uniref:hypothetical protein n=1 Tax=Bacteroides sp. TaxID=29523 RepID=UPI0025BCD317|nr:hypothetical protein [Bacteroides sp.]